MQWESLTQLLTELAKVVPQAVVIIILLVITNTHNSNTINKLSEHFSKEADSVKAAYKDASEQLRENIKLLETIRDKK